MKKSQTKKISTLFLLSLILSIGLILASEFPIGIPTPAFGIDETAGAYTHYVNNSGTCDDTANDGTPGNPRCTIPDTLSSGDVVEIHGTYTSGVVTINETGTPTNPIFIRGIEGEEPIFQGFKLHGEYIILENIYTSPSITIYDANNITVRNVEINGTLTHSIGFIVYDANDIVLLNSTIHNIGNYPNVTDDADSTGISVAGGNTNVWILYNKIYNTGGSGLQVHNGGSGNLVGSSQFVYIGGNIVHDTKQSGLFAKNSKDVIFSENLIYDIIDTSWSNSKGLGYQYGHERIWYLYNEVYNAEFGIFGGSDTNGEGGQHYIIGNLFHDLSVPSSFDTNDIYSPAGIGTVGGDEIYIIGNTIHNASAGLHIGASAGSYYVTNNIISEIFGEDASHIYTDRVYVMNNSFVYNNIFYNTTTQIRIRWGNSQIYNSVADFEGTSNWNNSWTGAGAGGNIEANPLFVSTTNFNLQTGSPAIDAGIASNVYDTFFSLYGIDIEKDIDGRTRPINSSWDIGAYEYDSVIRVNIDSPTNTTYATTTIDFNVTLDGEGDTCKYTLNNWVTNYTMVKQGDVLQFKATNDSMSYGSYIAKFWCNDTSGNINDTESVTFIIDTINPEVYSGPRTGGGVSVLDIIDPNGTIYDKDLLCTQSRQFLKTNGEDYTHQEFIEFKNLLTNLIGFGIADQILLDFLDNIDKECPIPIDTLGIDDTDPNDLTEFNWWIVIGAGIVLFVIILIIMLTNKNLIIIKE